MDLKLPSRTELAEELAVGGRETLIHGDFSWHLTDGRGVSETS